MSTYSDGVVDSDVDEYLHKGLVQALRKEKNARLCRDEPSDTSHLANLLSQGIIWSMVASVPLWLMVDMGLRLWPSLGIAAAFLALLVLFAGVTKRFGTAASMIFVAWATTGIASYSGGGFDQLALTHFLPFGLSAVGVWMWRALGLASGIPFLLPIALIVVFLPLLTQDLWVVGDDIGWQLLAVAIVALGPLLVVLGVRIARTDTEMLFITLYVERFAESEDFRSWILEAVKEAPREIDESAPEDDLMWERLSPSFSAGMPASWPLKLARS